MKHWHPLCCAAMALGLALPATAADFSAWKPAGWKMVAGAEGDLNGDGAADAVIVLQQQDAAKIVANDGLGNPTLDTNQRQIKVLLRQGAGYRLVAENRSWLPSAGDVDMPCLADPLLDEGSIEINRGVLKVSLGYWLSCGSWGVSRDTYTFRWQQNRLRLIGWDGVEFMRNSGDMTERSINYLTGRQKTVTGGNMFEDVPAAKIKTRWQTLPPQPARYLDGPSLPSPQDWE